MSETEGPDAELAELEFLRRENQRLNERLRGAGVCLSDLLYEWDVASDRLHWLGDIDAALGYEPGEIARTIEGWLQLIHPDDRPQLDDAVEFHRAHTQPIQEEYRVRTKDGQWRVWLDRATPVLDGSGRPVRWIGACVDATERRHAERNLRLSEGRFRAIAESAKDSIFIKDTDFRFTFVNPAMTRLLGCDAADLLGKTAAEVCGEDTAEVIAGVDRPVRDGEAVDAIRTLVIGGEAMAFHTIQVPLRDEVGRVYAICGIVRDVTQRQRAQRKRRELEAQLSREQRQRSLGGLAGDIAHECNNLLVGILGNANLAALDLPETSATRDALLAIESTALRAAQLVRKLLLCTGRNSMAAERADLAGLGESRTLC